MSTNFATILSDLGKAMDDRFASLEELINKAPTLNHVEVASPTPKAEVEAGATAKAESKKGKGKGKGKGKKDKEPKAPKVKVDDVREALRKVMTAGGNPAATSILEGFDVRKVSELIEEEFANVVSACVLWMDAHPSDDDGEDDEDGEG